MGFIISGIESHLESGTDKKHDLTNVLKGIPQLLCAEQTVGEQGKRGHQLEATAVISRADGGLMRLAATGLGSSVQIWYVWKVEPAGKTEKKKIRKYF